MVTHQIKSVLNIYAASLRFCLPVIAATLLLVSARVGVGLPLQQMLNLVRRSTAATYRQPSRRLWPASRRRHRRVWYGWTTIPRR
jgi:hypothetical protein